MKTETKPDTISDFLRTLDYEWQAYEEDGHIAFHYKKDQAGFTSAVRAQAELLIGLPERLSALEAEGMGIPNEIRRCADELAEQAQEGLDNLGSGIGTSHLIRELNYDHRVEGDISLLGLLALRYEPVCFDA